MRWTHITLPLPNYDASLAFFTETCGLRIVRDRRKEGGGTVWLGPAQDAGTAPEFVLVAFRGEVKEPLDHLGFQCESREEVAVLAQRMREQGRLVEGPVDAGGSVGYYAIVREPSGHLVEFTFGQPLAGLGAPRP
jgi:catechol 2,3-dioxygenase-like lactoylglutathione lyase family enzyme